MYPKQTARIKASRKLPHLPAKAYIRTDKLLSNLGYCSRSQVTAYLRDHNVTSSGETILKPREKVDPSTVTIDGSPLDNPEGLLIALNKPVGYTCSHDRAEGPLVYDLIPERWFNRKPTITTVGRLDKATSGLLLLTTVSGLVHRLTSPKNHVPKQYIATLLEPATSHQQNNMVNLFESGKLMLRGEDYPCQPAQLLFRDRSTAEVMLTEGRYHQVRRMFAACGSHVTALSRISFGNLKLESLKLDQGCWRHMPLNTFDS